MLRIAAIAALLCAAGCTTPRQPVMSTEFAPHGRFPVTMGRDQAYLECKLIAENAGRQMLNSGQPGTLPTLYGPPPAVVATVYSTVDTCMQSKGYLWTSPR